MRDPQDLIDLFNRLFADSEATVLVRGQGEPYYSPAAGASGKAEVAFAHGFFASALHEVAHWCIAGSARRKLADYGYWYKPDGRTAAEQAEFELCEVKPQAVEWVFSVAAGAPFHFSADNLSGEPSAAWLQFQANVASQARAYVTGKLPPRAARFAAALSARFGTGERYKNPESYVLT